MSRTFETTVRYASVIANATMRFLSFCVYIQETFDTENGTTEKFQYAFSLLDSYYHLKSHLTSGSKAMSPQFLARHALRVLLLFY